VVCVRCECMSRLALLRLLTPPPAAVRHTHLFLGRLQVFAAEGVHAIPEAALHQGVVHAQALREMEKGRPFC
jgi:hypothetical protein